MNLCVQPFCVSAQAAEGCAVGKQQGSNRTQLSSKLASVPVEIRELANDPSQFPVWGIGDSMLARTRCPGAGWVEEGSVLPQSFPRQIEAIALPRPSISEQLSRERNTEPLRTTGCSHSGHDQVCHFFTSASIWTNREARPGVCELCVWELLKMSARCVKGVSSL